MEQAVDAAKVDEGAVIGDILHHPLDELAFLERGQGGLTTTIPRLLQQHAARDDDVAAAMVDLDDLEGEGLAHEAVQIADRMQIDLGAGQKGLDADVHHHAALDPGNDLPFDALLLLVQPLQFLPDFHLVGFFLGEHQIAVCVFTLFEIHLQAIAHLQLLQLLLRKLIGGNHSLGLVADIDHHFVFADGDDDALGNRAFLEIAEGLLIHGRQGVAVEFGFALRADCTHDKILVLRLAPGAECDWRQALLSVARLGLVCRSKIAGRLRRHRPISRYRNLPEFRDLCHDRLTDMLIKRFAVHLGRGGRKVDRLPVGHRHATEPRPGRSRRQHLEGSVNMRGDYAAPGLRDDHPDPGFPRFQRARDRPPSLRKDRHGFARLN